METMETQKLAVYIATPIVAALIGWITNYVAVKMIFRPQKPVRIFGITFHGLVPKRQKELALNIAEMVERDLISHHDVKLVLQSPAIAAEVAEKIDGQVGKFVDKVVGNIPLLGMMVRGDMGQQVVAKIALQLKESIPEIMEKLGEKIETNLDFKTIIREKIEGFNLGKLEEIIYRISAKELRAIEVLGGVLGFIVGLGQVGLMLLAEL